MKTYKLTYIDLDGLIRTQLHEVNSISIAIENSGINADAITSVVEAGPGDMPKEIISTTPFKGEFKFRSPINREYSALPNVIPLLEDTESVMDININEDGTGFVEWDIEELDECEGIGLWFKGNELTDYDGVFEMPAQLVEYLETLGYNMDWCN